MSANVENARGFVDAHDGVIDHVFGAGLTLEAILRRGRVDDDVGERIRDALAALDIAVAELRTIACSQHLDGRPEQPEPQLASVHAAERRLCRFSVDEVFAYAVNPYDFHRASDHTLWAHESQGLLLSARSGVPLARRQGKVFYDIESNAPLYYEDGHATNAPAAPRTGS